MNCPTCHYDLGPFENVCPRCALAKKQSPGQTPPPLPPPTPYIPAPAAPVQASGNWNMFLVGIAMIFCSSPVAKLGFYTVRTLFDPVGNHGNIGPIGGALTILSLTILFIVPVVGIFVTIIGLIRGLSSKNR
ncbi:hypothetical protein EON80_31560 [bacterium]|nr:MAG: hypothetical protein EON80_31560 [bacterium]